MTSPDQNTTPTPLRPIERLGRWVIWLCTAMVLVELIYGLRAIYVYDFVTTWKSYAEDYRGVPWEIAATTFDNVEALVSGFYMLAYVAMAITYFVWVYRSSSNARVIDPLPDRITPGWAVGWHFVPLLMLWKPYIAVRQIWYSSHQIPGALTSKTPPLIRWWWIFCVLALFVNNFLFRVGLEAEFEDLDGVARIEFISAALGILVMLLTIPVVRSITTAQSLVLADQPEDTIR